MRWFGKEMFWIGYEIVGYDIIGYEIVCMYERVVYFMSKRQIQLFIKLGKYYE